MMKRWSFACAFVLLIAALVFPIDGATAAAPLAGTYTTGTDTSGHHYGFFAISAPATVTGVAVTFVPGTTSASIQCDVPAPNPNHGAGDPNNPYEWQPIWGLTNPTGTVSVHATCTTQWVRVDVGSAAAPTAISGSGALVGVGAGTTTSQTRMKKSPTGTPTNTPTSTPTSTPTGGAGTSAANCHDLGDGAVDQNGVSVDVWAPGLRKACGFLGYENGDDPMPAGTLMPAPRPFRFDYAVDHNEAVFGFKVYYRRGSEAPAGFGGTNGCGDVRIILHQGGGVSGFTTQFHTYQYTEVKCDAAGKPHIIDVGGQVDTGTLYLRSLPDSGRPAGPSRLTADILSCNGMTTFICATVWYSFFNFQLPGATNTGWSHMGFLIENPITLADPNNLSAYHPGPGDGTTAMLRDVQRYMPTHNASDWWCMWNLSQQMNEVVPAGTPAAWQMHVDPFFSEYQVLEPSSGTDHSHPVNGIVYPN